MFLSKKLKIVFMLFMIFGVGFLKASDIEFVVDNQLEPDSKITINFVRFVRDIEDEDPRFSFLPSPQAGRRNRLKIKKEDSMKALRAIVFYKDGNSPEPNAEKEIECSLGGKFESQTKSATVIISRPLVCVEDTAPFLCILRFD